MAIVAGNPSGPSARVGGIAIGGGAPLLLIAGPCVIEEAAEAYDTAAHLRDLAAGMGVPFIFKASYDKANRTSLSAYRGPGIAAGLRVLERIKAGLGVPVISDVHRLADVAPAAAVLDMIQIPAFLCRQTDLVLAAAATGKPLNIKKGQFLAPWDVAHVVAKARSTGNENILVTERGTQFGYNNLVVDLRGIPIMRGFGCPVVFDATHSVQLPGGGAGCSGGQREFAPLLARAAVAAGVDGVFLEVHRDPDRALCDGPNSLDLKSLPGLLRKLTAIHALLGPTP
jgi:2-dehydro-3-deoxyphosphooctonate aldolase (KDO 8-P synthase)